MGSQRGWVTSPKSHSQPGPREFRATQSCCGAHVITPHTQSGMLFEKNQNIPTSETQREIILGKLLLQSEVTVFHSSFERV